MVWSAYDHEKNYQNLLPAAVLRNACFQTFSANYCQSVCGRVIFSKIPSFQHIFMNIFVQIWKLFFERYLILDIQITSRLQKPNYKNIRWTYIKNESHKSNLGKVKNKEQCFQLFLDRTCILVLPAWFCMPDWAERSKFVQAGYIKPCKVLCRHHYG